MLEQSDISTPGALPAIDVPGMLSCLQELIKIPSVTGSTDETRAQHWLADRFCEMGLETDLWQIGLAEMQADPDFPGWEAPRSEAWGLVGKWASESGPTLILNGHIDVVPPGDLSHWRGGAPFEPTIIDNRLYGRGACDMKAGLVCNLFALKAIMDAGIRLKGTVLLQSVVGEEDGGLGTFATLRRGYRGDAAIITEPTEMQIIPACAGALTFRITVIGLSAHASLRQSGVSAIEKFWPFWEALKKLEIVRNLDIHPLMSRFELPYALSIGRLQSGDWPSSVPDKLWAEGRLGIALGETPEEARKQFEDTLAEVCDKDDWLREHRIKIDWFGGQFASGQTAINHPLVQLVRTSHYELHGDYPELHGATYGSDLRLMTNLANIPTLHYGPGSISKAHAADEFVPISETIAVTQCLIKIILGFCGVM